MKKLLAILVVFTLVVGAVFADVSVGAWSGATARLIGSDGVKDADLFTGRYGFGARMEASGENEDGTFGGHLKLFFGSHDTYGYAWWKPIDQFKLTLGKDNWGRWGRDNIVGWGWTGGAQDGGVTDGFNNYGVGDRGLGANTGFYGGFGEYAAYISVYPVEGLEINIGLPYWPDNLIQDTYMKLHAQVAYTIADIGTAAVTFVGNKGYKKAADNPKNKGEEGWDEGTGKLYASFDLSAIENMGLNIGVAFQFPKNYGDDLGNQPTKISYPLEAGVGFSFGLDAFNVKARVATKLAGSTEGKVGDKTVKIKDPLVLGFSILPSFDLEILKVFLNAGITFTGESEYYDGTDVKKADKSSSFGWLVNPYIQKEIGSGNFFIGFQLASEGVTGSAGDGDKAAVQWAIPMGITFGF